MADRQQEASVHGGRSVGRHAGDSAFVWVAAVASAVAVGLANASGISIGDDGVGYQAIADSLASGGGLGYFLEDPVTVWPPLWPGLMALVSRVTPFGAVGAAVLLNCVVAAAVVVAGNRLIRLAVRERTLVGAGTAVLALGPATIGLGHVLMTDMAFTLVVLVWMLLLVGATGVAGRDGASEGATAAPEDASTRIGYLIGAALIVWAGFGLRYVAVTLIGVGGLWLLVAGAGPVARRVRHAVLYGIVSALAPLAWMARNHGIDGTFTGERHTSARGLVHNLFDVAATIGRFLLPGVLNEAAKPWALVGIVGVAAATAATWMLLRRQAGDATRTLHVAWARLATPIGLVGTWAVLYVAYMVYVRTTTALNVLDLRLLFPAYFPMVIVGLAIADRLPRLGGWARNSHRMVLGWAAVNVVTGLVAMVGFGLGHPFFTGDYASSTFVAVRDNPALGSVPEGCETYSNLPNALYPVLEPTGWSPQRTALESIDPLDDLERIGARSADVEICLVWIDEEPTYGHLWTLDELGSSLTLEPLADDGPVQVFLVHPGAGR